MVVRSKRVELVQNVLEKFTVVVNDDAVLESGEGVCLAVTVVVPKLVSGVVTSVFLVLEKSVVLYETDVNSEVSPVDSDLSVELVSEVVSLPETLVVSKLVCAEDVVTKTELVDSFIVVDSVDSVRDVEDVSTVLISVVELEQLEQFEVVSLTVDSWPLSVVR